MIHSHTASFKSKWNSIKSWFSIPDLSKRRPSECSTASSCSCATAQDSPIISYLPLKRPSLMDISPFRKRPSLADIKSYSPFHKQPPPPTTTTTKTLIDIDQVIALYELALDELNYAQDSLGSPYYLGDRLAAQEAIDNCQEAYSLMDSPPDNDLTLKIFNLKTKLNSLPLEQEDQISL